LSVVKTLGISVRVLDASVKTLETSVKVLDASKALPIKLQPIELISKVKKVHLDDVASRRRRRTLEASLRLGGGDDSEGASQKCASSASGEAPQVP